MTKKEKAIRKFAKAMRSACVEYYAEKYGDTRLNLTPNMQEAWYEFIIGCIAEAKDVKPTR